jgi:predicted cupin superfamily sugar epimerase
VKFFIAPAGSRIFCEACFKSAEGQCFQHVVLAGCWFASEPVPGIDFSFLGCTVAPGFDFKDFEMANADDLILLYPAYVSIIKRMCRT